MRITGVLDKNPHATIIATPGPPQNEEKLLRFNKNASAISISSHKPSKEKKNTNVLASLTNVNALSTFSR